MATVSLVWADGDRLRMAPVRRDEMTSIGRGDDCSVVLIDPAVSRRHAILRPQAEGYRLESVSETNSTRINGRLVKESADLSDGDSIEAGSTSLVFHDLRAGDRISGPICSHCGRENDGPVGFCWFCGTSLVNALSGARERLRLAFRAVTPDGTTYDVYPGQALQLNGEEGPSVCRVDELPATAAGVEAGERGVKLRLHDRESSLALNGQAAAIGASVSDGDELTGVGGRLLLLVRGTG